MKKFLTVLLVIAVMFTFSFGSAFATTATPLTTAQQAVYDAAVGPSNAILDARFEAFWAANTDHVVTDATGSYIITVKAYDGLKEEAKGALVTAIYTAAGGNDPLTSAPYTVAGLTDLFDTNDEIKAIVDTALAQKLAVAQFAIDYAKELAKLDTVDVYAYSTEYWDVANEVTHQAKAAKIIADAKVAAKAIADTIDADSTLGECVHAFIALDDIVADEDTNSVVTTEALAPVMLDGLFSGAYTLADTSVLKTAAAAADKAEKEANKAALKAVVAQKVADYQKTEINAGRTPNATLIAAYTEMYATRIDSLNVTDAQYIYGVAGFAGKKLVDNYKLVQKLVAYADKYKAELNADGDLVRNAAAIDKIVKAGKEDAYNMSQDDAWLNLGTYKARIEATTLEAAADNLAYVKENAKNLLKNFVEDNADDYYPAELAKLNALVEEASAKIDAATKATEVYNPEVVTDLYDVYMTKLGAVLTEDEVADAIDAKAAYGAAKTALKNYATYLNGTLTTVNDQITKTIVNTDAAVEAVLDEFYGEAGARTETELKALKDQIISLVDKLPTTGAQSTAKAAAQAAIKALPAVITLADEALVQAAVDAVNAYTDLGGSDVDTTALETARTALYNAYKLDLSKKVVAADKTDKAALNAILDEFKAAQKKNGAVADGKCLSGTDFKTISSYTTLTTALTNIQEAEKAAVKKAINAIPVNVTEADKATVEAARALYDAYVAEYTDYEDDAFASNAANDFNDCFRTLALAEAALGLNYDAEENAKAYVQDLKIAARSTKTSKGVKVTIKADVQQLLDDGFTVEYKFYRSTKSNAKFGSPKITKTTNTYLNTSGKKGTRYYYKARLVVKNAKGEVVAITPLSQCLYATRVF